MAKPLKGIGGPYVPCSEKLKVLCHNVKVGSLIDLYLVFTRVFGVEGAKAQCRLGSLEDKEWGSGSRRAVSRGRVRGDSRIRTLDAFLLRSAVKRLLQALCL